MGKKKFPDQIYVAWDDEFYGSDATLVAFDGVHNLEELHNNVQSDQRVAIYKKVADGKLKLEVKVAMELDEPKKKKSSKKVKKDFDPVDLTMSPGDKKFDRR